MSSLLRLAAIVALGPTAALAQHDFVNWENPHVHPMDITPDGKSLVCVNTADDRLQLFDISFATALLKSTIQVGLDPVSVRVRNDGEAWVVNHISDSISIVDLVSSRVVRTLPTLDEPTDVVFAGVPERAFVSCSQANTVLVFDPDNLEDQPIEVAIDGEDPRAMAVSPNGQTVYVAVFESGNATTLLGGGSLVADSFPPNVINDLDGPYAGVNPPPNDGAGFSPPFNTDLPMAPWVGLIVRKDKVGRWLDDNDTDWTAWVSGPSAASSGRPIGWDLPDHDVAVIDASTLAVSYADRLMTMCMAIGVNPASGAVTVVGTDARNHIRYEPNVNGRFITVNMATLGAPSTVVDLNAHLDYSTPTVTQDLRDQSLGDPRGITWNAAGTRGYITGLGSNNVIVVDALGNRAGSKPTIEVGEGPTGIVLDEFRDRMYVLNHFDASISVVDLDTETEIQRVGYFDPTPAAIRDGRKHLYDTHATSGLGHLSCAGCHVDARMDRLAWDLGNPAGDMLTFNQNCNNGTSEQCEDWHPMKGPMTTQTLQDIVGKEPLHWRGDRTGIEDFNGAFLSVLGDDQTLTDGEMAEFEAFLATIAFPPNPFRNFDNSLPDHLPLPGHFTTGLEAPAGLPLPAGNAVAGLDFYRSAELFNIECVTCHTLPTGVGPNYAMTDGQLELLPPGPDGELHHSVIPNAGSSNSTMKTPQLRNLYEKVGFDLTQTSNRAGFGFTHDGAVDSLARFVTQPMFVIFTDQQVADLVAFLLSYSGSDLPTGSLDTPEELPGPPSLDSHAAVGAQVTLIDAASAPLADLQRIADMVQLAEAGAVGLIVKGRVDGQQRGFVYQFGGLFQSDRVFETWTAPALNDAAAPGSELTFTVVPFNARLRLGVDRDSDGHFDRDELDDCSDPANAAIMPPQCPGCLDDDLDGYGIGVDCLGADCNDGSIDVHPGATEVCGDGLDNDCNGVADDADLAIIGSCADGDDDGIRDDNCLWWGCGPGGCASTDIPFADMGGQFGSCAPDGTADGNDRFHALNCFSDTDVDQSVGYPCEALPPLAYNVDAGGAFGSCVSDGVCDGNDAFHALNAFAGSGTCSCPLDPAPQFSRKTGVDIVDRARLRLIADATTIEPGRIVSVDVLMAVDLDDLRGYQLHVDVAGGKSGHLELIDIAINHATPLSDRAASARQRRTGNPHTDPGQFQAHWSAFNRTTRQMVAGTDANGLPIPSGTVLATFTFRATDDARGSFAVDVLHGAGGRTFLFPTPANGAIAIAGTESATVTVTAGRRAEAPKRKRVLSH